MFKVVNNKGFAMTFENGYEVSVMFGEGNYSSSRYVTGGEPIRTSKNAEIAVFSPDGEYVTKKAAKEALDIEIYDDALGWESPTTVLKLQEWASQQ